MRVLGLKRPLQMRWVTLSLAASFLVAGILAGCGGTPSGGGASPSTAGAPQYGGTVRIVSFAPAVLDPLTTQEDAAIYIGHNVLEGLLELNRYLETKPVLATSWESSPDATVWTVHLREGVKFSNGHPFDANSVLYSFKRMRDPKLGSSTVGLFSGISFITAPNPSTVVFTFKKPSPDFPMTLGDRCVVMFDPAVKDPGKNLVGTGPFILSEYRSEDRAVLKRNPNYWMKDDQGRQLPYLDSLEVVFSPDIAAHIAAVQGGQGEYTDNIPPEFAKQIKADPNLTLIEMPSNFYFTIHMRSDKGHVAANPKVREALKLATNCEEIVAAARQGYGVVGNGTCVGPMYKEYFLNKKPVYDPARAKQLLAEAGYPNGLTIELTAQRYNVCPIIASVWQQQLKKIGVNANITVVTNDIYYGSGRYGWLNVDFGITDWGTRPVPVNYFSISYVTGAPWAESHWSDPEFDSLTAEILRTTDKAKRIDLYHQAQQILIDRGPDIVPYDETSLILTSAKFHGLDLSNINPYDQATCFRSAWMAK